MAHHETDPSDSGLVDQLNHGSGTALATLFDRHADAIYNYCFRRTASWHSAEDATATVFLEAWRGREKVTVHDGSALPWLYGIANNVCRNATRSSRRGLRALGRVAPDLASPDHADHVASQVDSERRMAAVLAAISRLPRHEQDVLALVAWTGLTYDETAAALGVPAGTVRSRLSRARNRLTQTLGDAAPHTPRLPSEDDHA